MDFKVSLSDLQTVVFLKVFWIILAASNFKLTEELGKLLSANSVSTPNTSKFIGELLKLLLCLNPFCKS